MKICLITVSTVIFLCGSLYSGMHRAEPNAQIPSIRTEPLTPAETVKLYYKLAAEGNLEQARRMLQSEFGSISIDISKLPPGIEQLIRDGKVNLKRIDKERINGNQAEVDITVSDGKGELSPMRFLLRRKNSNAPWEIFSYLNLNAEICHTAPEACTWEYFNKIQ